MRVIVFQGFIGQRPMLHHITMAKTNHELLRRSLKGKAHRERGMAAILEQWPFRLARDEHQGTRSLVSIITVPDQALQLGMYKHVTGRNTANWIQDYPSIELCGCRN